MKHDIEYNEQVLVLMTKLRVSKAEAEIMVDTALADPEKFAKRAAFIRDYRNAADARPVKGITLHHTRHRVGRNEKCACGSGKKFKKCKCFTEPRKIGYIIHRVENENSDSAEPMDVPAN